MFKTPCRANRYKRTNEKLFQLKYDTIIMKKTVHTIIYTLLLIPAIALAANEMPMDMKHKHSPLELPESAYTPQLNISITADDMSGYNLNLDTSQFQLESPRNIGNTPKGVVEGHGHLYVNGTKIQRIYGTDVHIPGKHFKKGMNQISVTLNSHDHRVWQKEGKAILSTVFINTEKEKLISHQFSTFPVVTN